MSGTPVVCPAGCSFWSLTDPPAPKNPDNVIRGLKAAIHNPNVSEAGKKHAAEQLSEMGVSVDLESSDQTNSASLGGHAITTKTTVVESGKFPFFMLASVEYLIQILSSIPNRIHTWGFDKR